MADKNTLFSAISLLGDELAYVDCLSGRSWTYSELASEVRRATAVLGSVGLGQRAAVIIAVEDSVAMTVLLAALWQLDGIAIPIPAAQVGEQIGPIAAETGANAAILSRDEQIGHRVAAAGIVEVTIFDTRLALFKTHADRTPSDPNWKRAAMVAYTSGTTGNSKGVMLSHETLATAAQSMATAVGAHRGQRVLFCLAPFHMYGIAVMYAHLLSGGTLYLSPGGTPGAMASAICEHRINALPLQPQHFEKLRQVPHQNVWRDIEYIACASGSLPAAIIREMAERAPNADIFVYYALTEAPRAVYIKNPHQRDPTGHAIGAPASGMAVHLKREDGRDAAVGELGEIVVLGPLVALGYLNRPAENESCFAEGSFKTGDLAVRDSEGTLYYRGRKSDLLFAGATLVNPWELERAIEALPGVRGAVAGLAENARGTRVFGIVVEGEPTTYAEEAIRQASFPAAALLGLEPRMIFADALPRNAMGKIVRTEALRLFARKGG